MGESRKSMGGYGSGRWYRGGRMTTDGLKRLDIRWMHQQGLLRKSGLAILTWSRGAETIGSLQLEMRDSRIVVRYQYHRSGDPWRAVEEIISLDRTRCNYGGERLWFLCPHCGTRIAVLYGAGARFLCRHCYQLTYASQSEDILSRTQRKARKIRERLGASENLTEPLWRKPKGMHWKTFERLRQRERDANDSATLAWVGQAEKVLRRGGNRT